MLKPELTYTDFGNLSKGIFEHCLANDISFVVMDEQDRMVGVALNTDEEKKLDVKLTGLLAMVLEFLEFIESPIRYG